MKTKNMQSEMERPTAIHRGGLLIFLHVFDL